MSYCVKADLIKLIPESVLAQLTDDDDGAAVAANVWQPETAYALGAKVIAADGATIAGKA